MTYISFLGRTREVPLSVSANVVRCVRAVGQSPVGSLTTKGVEPTPIERRVGLFRLASGIAERLKVAEPLSYVSSSRFANLYVRGHTAIGDDR
jgi:hypothetical protein